MLRKWEGKRVRRGTGAMMERVFQESGFIYDHFHSANILEHFEWDNILNFKTPTASLFLLVYFRVKVQNLITLGKLVLWNLCPCSLRCIKDKMCAEICVILGALGFRLSRSIGDQVGQIEPLGRIGKIHWVSCFAKCDKNENKTAALWEHWPLQSFSHSA